MELKLKQKSIHNYDDFIKNLMEIYNYTKDQIIICNDDKKDKEIVNNKNDNLILTNDININIAKINLVKNYLIADELEKILNISLIKSNYTNIIIINLTANELESIPKSFKSLVNINRIILNNNKLKKIENLDNLNHLEKLEFMSNKITKIENLNTLKSLKYLTLSTNLIQSYEEDDIPYIESLIELGLFGNFLGCENVKKDEKINLNNINLLKNFCIILNKKFPNLKNIFIGGNYFTFLNENENKFREIVKECIPNIQMVDGVDV